MDKKEFEEKLKALVVDKLGVSSEEVTPEVSFTNDLGADSLDRVELLVEAEKMFGISIPDEERAEELSVYGTAMEYLYSLVN